MTPLALWWKRPSGTFSAAAIVPEHIATPFWKALAPNVRGEFRFARDGQNGPKRATKCKKDEDTMRAEYDFSKAVRDVTLAR